ncbi:MAG: hypothetical protein QXH71_00015 [Candidatus Anstonellaceae archaeon]
MGIELRDILKNTKVLLWNKKTIKERYKQLRKIGIRKKDLNKQFVFFFVILIISKQELNI